MTHDAGLEAGRDAFAARRWREALERLTAADAVSPLAEEDLERLASAAFLVGAFDVQVEALERAHRGYAEAGRLLAAARTAFLIGLSLMERGDRSLAAGWLARAREAVDAHGGDSVERGWLLLPEIQRALSSGDTAAAAALAERAAALARRFGDADLAAFMLHARGLALVREGRVSEGLGLFDEAIVALASGDLTPRVTGTLYCSVISACLGAFAVQRADEWTQTLDAWCADQPDLVPYAGACRVYRAEVLHLRGDWDRALAEAEEAERRCAGGVDPPGVAAARYRRAEVLRVRGDGEAAESAYRAAAQAGRDPQPGLAWLRLRQGDAEAALAALRRSATEARDAAKRARLLPALVEAAVTRGEHGEARAAADELERVAVRFDSAVLAAQAAHARGVVALASGDDEGALRAFRDASEGWIAAGAPYDQARSRMGLARACARLGDRDGAALELGAARAIFERLGAVDDAADARAELEGVDTSAPPGPSGGAALSAREREVLRLVADGERTRTIARRLGISERTVERHVSNACDKLGATSRAAAAATAVRLGLL